MKIKIKTLLITLITIITLLNYPVISQNNIPVTQQLTNIEIQYYNKNFENDSILDRIERLEKDLLGSKQTGGIFNRMDNVNIAYRKKIESDTSNQGSNTNVFSQKNFLNKYKEISGLTEDLKGDSNSNESASTGAPPTHPQGAEKKPLKKQKAQKKQAKEDDLQITSFTDSYFDSLLNINQNKIIRWKRMPVKIYIPEGSNITYNSSYRKIAIRALNIWKVKSGGVVDYVLVDNAKKANITLVWQDNFIEEPEVSGRTSSTTGFNQTQSFAGNVLSSSGMFMPGYFGLGASLLGAVVGGIGNNRAKLRDVKMTIGTLPAMKLGKSCAQNYIESIISHEFGHAIGISCHSININDIMYAEVPVGGLVEKQPSQRDIATIIELYRHPADISD